MERMARKLVLGLVSGMAVLLAACGGGSNSGSGGGNQGPTTPSVTVTPANSSIATTDSLAVTVRLSGTSSTPTGTVILTGGTYNSPATALAGGTVSITIPAGSLTAGSVTLKASYAPDSSSSSSYNSASGTAAVTVTSIVAPTVTVTPAASSITTAQSLSLTVTVAGASGSATPTGTVTLSSGSYASLATALMAGSATITVAAGALPMGTDTLTASYAPDAGSSSVYSTASGTATVTVAALATPTVTVTPATNSTTTAQSLQVTVTVAGTTGAATPTGTVTLTSGSYTSAATRLTGGSVTIAVPAGSLALGSDTLKAAYTPDAGSSSTYGAGSGTALVTVTVATPTVTVSPASSSIGTGQSLKVTITVAGPAGAATPTGTVTLTSGPYLSGPKTLINGSVIIAITGGTFAQGSATLSASYTPDATGSSMYASGSGTATITINTQTTPTVTVSPASQSLATSSSLNVTVKVSGSGSTPTGSVVLSSGTYSSSSTALASGSAAITVPAYSLVYGSDGLTAAYTPDASGSGLYNNASGSATVSVARATPTVTVTPAKTSISPLDTLNVTVGVGGSGAPAGTGTVSLSGGGYTSPSPVTISGATVVINLPAGALATGSNTLTASYAPDTASSAWYKAGTGTSAAITVSSLVSVNQSTTLAPVTNQLLGINLESWYDNVGNASSIDAAFGKAGIKAIRWPGGSWSDAYHWNPSGNPNGLPNKCDTNTTGAIDWTGTSTFTQFVSAIPLAGQFDLALTANYGSNAACTKGGDPTEAASWAAEAVTLGYPPSHITVGNEIYGTWEYDLHAKKNDPTTYANSVIGANGYYQLIHAASPTSKVGVVVNATGTQAGWDSTVLSLAKGSYDFVEYHYYPQYTTVTDDTPLVHQYALDFSTNINNIQAELAALGEQNIPIYVGEVGGNSGNPGTQSWSITQGLYAGQLLGEAMKDGVSRLTWWDGFGNCFGPGNNSPLLYGWQAWGSQAVFSAGPGDVGQNGPCPGAGPIGTMSPTVRALQLFSNIAVNGESALGTTVNGDTTNIRAYSATHSGGTALFMFNLNQNQSQPVTITLSKTPNGTSSDVTVITYDKSIYDQSNPANAGGVVWADPTTTDMGAQNLPLTLTLTPWSMNVVIIK